MSKDTRARAYCFTINNPTDKDLEDLKVLSQTSKYMIVGKEKGEKGTEHYQGYIYFSEAKSFSSIKKKLKRAHIEVAKGSPESNENYCGKDGDVIIRVGECPKQGKRSDIDNVREKLKEGSNMSDIVNSAKSMQSIRLAEVWLKYNEKGRDWKPEIRWYHGSTGSGKTRAAREWLEKDIYTCLDNIKWWEGYDAHESVLIDDFRKDFCKFHQLLKLLDRYEYKVEVKGGSRQLLAKKIAITCPYPPDKVYETREDVKQLLRRIDEVILIGKPVIDPEDEEDPLDFKKELN